jgi:hypothetical protein
MAAAIVPRPPSKGLKDQIEATATKIDNCKSGGYTTINLRGGNNNDIKARVGEMWQRQRRQGSLGKSNLVKATGRRKQKYGPRFFIWYNSTLDTVDNNMSWEVQCKSSS